jgi:hypothetical protein
MGTRTTNKHINRITTTHCLVVSYYSLFEEDAKIQFDVLFRLRINQASRPATYDEIQSSPAMKSLPKEITSGETEMVKNVITNIPVIPDDY